MTRYIGHDAISLASLPGTLPSRMGVMLRKHSDPTGDPDRPVSIDEARDIAREDPSLIYADVTDDSSAVSAVRPEVRRVFGAAFSVEDGMDMTTVVVSSPLWHEAITYRVVPLLATLSAIADGAGESERGDANVCTALEAAGAVVEMS